MLLKYYEMHRHNQNSLLNKILYIKNCFLSPRPSIMSALEISNPPYINEYISAFWSDQVGDHLHLLKNF